MLYIGAHMSVAKGIAKAAEDVVKMNANTMQFFSRNPRGSNFKIYTNEEIEKFQSIRTEYNFGPLLAHAPYTLNLASATEKTYEFACMVIREDIARMNDLGIEYLVFHPGSHTGIGTEAGIQNIINGLNQAITGAETLTVLLETMSGKGSEIGVTFEELKKIRDGLEHPERVGICLDTCHVFSAGYDIVHNLDGVLDEFDRILGLDLLKCIHLNDSMMPFGANKDRHATLGNGEIGMEAILKILKHPKLQGIPVFLETPLDDDGHKLEIELIKINIHPLSGWFFSFGYNPNTTGHAQVRLLLACQPRIGLIATRKRVPWIK